ncbi:MAG TPA: PAS domain S-box protein [Bryobacteraceae bacterium]|nr:PAS domain S-box protein [Bryobacteraceae bacterium]
MGRPEDLSGWRGYGVAFLFTLAAVFFRQEVGRLTGEPISLTLCGLAAVFATTWLVGLGPSLLAAALTSAWFIFNVGTANPAFWIHDGLYIVEAAAFCVYGRQLRVARDAAADGADWQRHLIETAGEGIWTVDPKGIVRNANPRIAEMLGCREDEIVGRPVEDFLFREDVTAERIRLQNRRPGVREQYDRRLRRADGSELWTLACSSPYSSRGRDAGVLTMMTDITERKQAEHALRRSERRFRELFENIREGVYQTSIDGRILAANPELLRMLGFTHEDELNVPGVVKGTFVDPELHLTLRDRLERDGSYANVEFQLRTRDCRIITVSENARVVRDENGDILYFEGTLTDITGKPRNENETVARDFRAIRNEFVAGLHEAMESLPPDHPAHTSVTRALDSVDALTRRLPG